MPFDLKKIHQILSEKKYAQNWSGFHPRENHRGLIVGSAVLMDSNYVSIPGMTLQIELRAGTVVGDCLITYSIFQLVGLKRVRAYQLEVCPADKLSHNGEEKIYGPHEHLPDGETHVVKQNGVDCSNWDASFNYFLLRTNIESFHVEQPC